MKKTLIVFSILLSVIIGFTNFTSPSAPVLGDRFPDVTFKLSDNHTGDYFTFENYRGSYLLINFWDTRYPDSRLKGAFYRQWLKKADNRFVSFVEVNFDNDEGVLMDIAERDGLKNHSIVRPESAEFNKIIERLRMQNEMKSFLIDADGYIVAINPDIDELDRLMGKEAV